MKKKYYYTNQISNKFKSLDLLPEWLASYPNYNDQIKLLRETLGMTQTQLASKVGMTLRSIQMIENGEAAPKISTLRKISVALNTELKISLVPQKNIIEYLTEKAKKKAMQLVNLNKASAALEKQIATYKTNEELENRLVREILENKREILWRQKETKK